MSIKHFIIFFSIFFVIFSIIGYKNGSEDVSSPEFLKHYIFKKISTVQINESEYLAYKRGYDTLFMFNIDSNKLIPIDKEFFLSRDTQSIPDKNLLKYLNTTVYTAFGAGALGYSIKDLFKSAETIGGKWKSAKGKGSILGVILGSISGYGFGYWLATNSAIPSENSKEIREILISQEKWIEAKETIFAKIWFRTKELITSIKEIKYRKEFLLEQRLFLRQWKFNDKNDIIIDSKLFRTLLTLQSKVEPVYEKESSEPTTGDRIFQYIGYGIIILGFSAYLFFIAIPELSKYYSKVKLKKIGQPNDIQDSIKFLSVYLNEKEKAKYKAMTEKEFSETNYRLKDTINDAWNLGWEYFDNSKKNKIVRPIILEQFSTSGLKYSWDVEKVILQSFHRNLLGIDIDIEGQIKTLIDEDNERQKKRNKTS